LAVAAKERAREWAAEAASSGNQAARDLQRRAASVSSQASEVVTDMSDRVRLAAHPYARSAQQAVNDPAARDKLLLGGAGIAVVAALSIALQRRFRQADGQL
jgi:hypothetical protein